ncbi:PIN domain-containing protein [Nocardioides panaciterrulae]|uniref:Putative nucleic acid-binding protein n=1 Tax=Nocardioides panaciterrulae TaxID=661492 RepID=A0A7Y9JBG4_9ACTN|nr:putative nucleic acid-binding protein [Nocardioides panaciterrulae]
MSRFPALFDTNVLFGFHLNDVILGLAERGLFRPLWSERILDELSTNLAEHGIPDASVKRRVDAMRHAFPDATVSGFDDLIGTMTNDPKDRHVLAAGIRANCEVLVTFNLKDFPDESVDAYDIEIVHPDKFLLDQLDLYPGPTVEVLRQLIADYSSPTLEMEDLLVRLADAGVPDFASAVRRYL